jgi:hypothetical protein
MRKSVSLAAAALTWGVLSSGTAQGQVGLDIGDVVETIGDVTETVTTTVTETVPETVTQTVNTVTEPAAAPVTETVNSVVPIPMPETVVAPPVAVPAVVDPATAAPLNQVQAIQAVEQARALPLEQIIQSATSYTAGNVVDANLMSVRGLLVYQIKVIEDNGRVNKLYFYARSGQLVRKN